MFKQHCGRFIQVYITVVWILDLVKLDPIDTFGLSMKKTANWGCCLLLFYLLIICLFCWFVFICLVWKLYTMQIRTSKSQMWLTVFKQLFCPTNLYTKAVNPHIGEAWTFHFWTTKRICLSKLLAIHFLLYNKSLHLATLLYNMDPIRVAVRICLNSHMRNICCKADVNILCKHILIQRCKM